MDKFRLLEASDIEVKVKQSPGRTARATRKRGRQATHSNVLVSDGALAESFIPPRLFGYPLRK